MTTNRLDYDVSFHDSAVPQVSAGEYAITLTQELVDEQGMVLEPALDRLNYPLRVAAPRFTLPPGTVHAVFPQAGSTAGFSNALAHLTLADKTLPWCRSLGDGAATGTPWLALMVFGTGDLANDAGCTGEVTVGTVQQLLTPSDGVAVPEVQVSTGEKTGECASIEVPARVFDAIAPRLADLPYLAHMREVAERSVRFRNGEQPSVGSYSVVLGNRFPQAAGGRYVAHLVSLEGHNRRLTGETAQSCTTVRLVSLHHWSYQSSPHNPGSAFSAGVKALAAPGSTVPRDLALTLRPTSSPRPGPEIERRLKYGYVPLVHQLPTGERSYCWYRGPLSAVVPPVSPRPTDGYRSAHQAMTYLPQQGVFDVSYAAAWNFGRLTAMSDPTYAAHLAAFRHTAFRAVRQLAQNPGLAALTAHGHDRAEAEVDWPALRRQLTADPWDTLDELFPDTLVEDLNTPPARGFLRQAPSAVWETPPQLPDVPAMLALQPVRTALREAVDGHAGPVGEWLADLRVLRGVPVEYLVPDPGMLPPESLRFFNLDPLWVDAVVDGALSLGTDDGRTKSLNRLLDTDLYRTRSDTSRCAGVLLRSDLLAAVPELIIDARTKDGAPLEWLRRDMVGHDTLLCLWQGVPETVTLREPGSGLHFGTDGGGSGLGKITLRYLTASGGHGLGEPLGEFPSGGASVDDYLRAPVTHAPGARVLSLTGLGGIVPAMTSALHGHLPADGLGPGAFGLQLLNAPQELTIHAMRPASV
ncbi:hypothetical protein [Streptomyces sp. NPDC051577]|uniref:hypothetical protein n=1 Tax=Streptomyces sp. NPDC051577 TaxID=3155166 RepID=UPI003424AC24